MIWRQGSRPASFQALFLRLSSFILALALNLQFIQIAFYWVQPEYSIAETKPKKDNDSTKTKERKERRTTSGKVTKPANSTKDRAKQSIDREDSGDFQGSTSGKSRDLDIVLVLDGSGSMQRTDPWRLRNQGARLLSRFLSVNDRLAIVEFDRSSRIVMEFREVKPETQVSIDSTIDSTTVEGRYTNLYSPLEDALTLLKTKGRQSAEKSVVLISDGTMDPHVTDGSAEQVTEKLFSQVLPQFRDSGIKIYTLALSKEADEKFLGSIAQATNAMHWYAPDVNSVHMKFSDLFLSLKKPQIITARGKRFEIDPRVEEATFYISRQETGGDVTLVDPNRNTISVTSLPPSAKWYRGSYFDLISIVRPVPGSWMVAGLEKFDGHSTLITDLELQVSWPEKQNFSVGEKLQFKARLIDNGEVVDRPGIKEVTFFSYKIIDTQTDEVTQEGNLADDGEDGDEKAKDFIFAASTILGSDGEFKAVIAVESQTFTRQKHIPFSVSDNLVTLSIKPEDAFEKKEERFYISLSKKAQAFPKKEVTLKARNTKSGEEVKIEPALMEGSLLEYEVVTSKLPNGEYEVIAILSGHDASKKNVHAESAPLEIEISKERHLTPEEMEAIKEREESIFWGLVSAGIATLWISVLCFLLLAKVKRPTSGGKSLKSYKVPAELEDIVSSAEEKVGNLVHKPERWEKEVFSMIDEVMKPSFENRTLVDTEPGQLEKAKK